MKPFVLLLVSVLILSCAKKEYIKYTLSYKKDSLEVNVNLKTFHDTIHFTYGYRELGGIKDQRSWIKNITSICGGISVDSAYINVFPSMSGKASFSYNVKRRMPDHPNTSGCIYDMFCPDIDSVMFYSHGSNIFVKPILDYAIPVFVEWSETPDFPIFCLYNAGHGTEKFEGTIDDIGWTILLGDPMLNVDTVNVNGNVNYLLTAFRFNSVENKEEVKTFFRRVFQTYTTFWNEKRNTPYTLMLFPFRENTFSVSGNGFRNGFLARYSAKADTILTTDRRDVFTHEIGHSWIGNGPTWFSEGFNEMQTAYQIIASGLDKPSFFAKYFNVALKGLYNNPHKNASNEEAESKFWDDGQYIKLLYWRGFNYAFYLSGLIEKETGSINAYKDMMMILKDDISNMTGEKFIKDMSRLLDSARLEGDYQKYIIEGKDFEYKQDELPTGCKIIYEDGTPKLVITDSIQFERHFK